MSDTISPLDDDAAQEFAARAAQMLGVAIAPEWMPAVIANLRANAAAAQLVTSFPLDDETESASVFHV